MLIFTQYRLPIIHWTNPLRALTYWASCEGNRRNEAGTGPLSRLISVSLGETKISKTGRKSGLFGNFLLSETDSLLISSRAILPYERQSFAVRGLFLFHTNVQKSWMIRKKKREREILLCNFYSYKYLNSLAFNLQLLTIDYRNIVLDRSFKIVFFLSSVSFFQYLFSLTRFCHPDSSPSFQLLHFFTIQLCHFFCNFEQPPSSFLTVSLSCFTVSSF